jgi:hypothetical protein
MNSGYSEAFGEYQIEITDGYALEPLVTSRPKVMPLAGIANESSAEMNTPRATSLVFTSKDYSGETPSNLKELANRFEPQGEFVG